MFLEECKYVIKEKKFHKYIIDDVEIYCDSDEEILLEKIQMEKNSNYEENSEEILEKMMVEKNLMKKILLKIIKFFLHV